MVCLGNICRSPLAEGILRSKLDTKKYIVDSAGTGHWHIGNPPDNRSIKVGTQNGLDISQLKGRQFSEQDFIDFDHIFVMDQNNLEDVLAMATTEAHKEKVSMILDAIFPGEDVDVPDPYNGTMTDFKRVYEMLNQACEVIATQYT